jgi:hypothetical protein
MNFIPGMFIVNGRTKMIAKRHGVLLLRMIVLWLWLQVISQAPEGLTGNASVAIFFTPH